MSNKLALKLVTEHISVSPLSEKTLYLNHEQTEKLVKLLEPKSRKPRAPAAPRPRNVLFDALVKIEGINPREIGPKAGSRIAAALKEIKTASPDVTPEEIIRRALAYRTEWPNAALTSQALAINWARFGTEVKPIGEPTLKEV
jgi:hypothetical protein